MPIVVGVLAAVCFSVTFVVNRALALHAGHWAWSGSLRYFLSVPMLLGIVAISNETDSLRRTLRQMWHAWFTWGTVGFVLFYAPLVAAASFSPGWVVAATWPVTIVMGTLLAPVIYKDHRRRIAHRTILGSVTVLVGIGVLQFERWRSADFAAMVGPILLVLMAAVSYPFGNRKAMLAIEASRDHVSTSVRLAAMTIGSIPAWCVLSAYGYARAGWPTLGQIEGVFVVALFSGVIATSLFFRATDSVRDSPASLAAVEATQAAEVPGTLIMELLLLGGAVPTALGWLGLVLIVFGIVWHSFPELFADPRPTVGIVS